MDRRYQEVVRDFRMVLFFDASLPLGNRAGGGDGDEFGFTWRRRWR